MSEEEDSEVVIFNLAGDIRTSLPRELMMRRSEVARRKVDEHESMAYRIRSFSSKVFGRGSNQPSPDLDFPGINFSTFLDYEKYLYCGNIHMPSDMSADAKVESIVDAIELGLLLDDVEFCFDATTELERIIASVMPAKRPTHPVIEKLASLALPGDSTTLRRLILSADLLLDTSLAQRRITLDLARKSAEGARDRLADELRHSQSMQDDMQREKEVCHAQMERLRSVVELERTMREENSAEVARLARQLQDTRDKLRLSGEEVKILRDEAEGLRARELQLSGKLEWEAHKVEDHDAVLVPANLLPHADADLSADSHKRARQISVQAESTQPITKRTKTTAGTWENGQPIVFREETVEAGTSGECMGEGASSGESSCGDEGEDVDDE